MPHRISIVLGLSTALLLAPGVRAGDLLQTYRDALANDSQFAASRAQLDAGREKIPQGRAGLLPTIGLSANSNWNDVEAKLACGNRLALQLQRLCAATDPAAVPLAKRGCL